MFDGLEVIANIKCWVEKRKKKRRKTRCINRHGGGFIRPTPQGQSQFMFNICHI